MNKRYASSRLTSGNFLFPDEVTVAEDGIHFVKRRIFGSDEEIISYGKIASVKLNSGIFFADITVETTGGSQPIFINGLMKGGAQEIKDAIRYYQGQEE
ncbi:MAG: PH domain-containing protein [Anaerolineales bacterium]|uniref:PH domain-containing protein n=1 Tax=Candidatus Desulfolinea nitratireducens TaxID=2841698 RepID=A0A8J6NLT0_9CHLR|nr:PH domain-containing protein [Candidatus Desulfolinea nitratireducens]MBL6961081.1 PH domain-containing protein [Anaerolineales bacterium]